MSKFLDLNYIAEISEKLVFLKIKAWNNYEPEINRKRKKGILCYTL